MLFTARKTINVILKKLYKEKKIVKNILKSTLKELLYICIKQLHLHFTLNTYFFPIRADNTKTESIKLKAKKIKKNDYNETNNQQNQVY